MGRVKLRASSLAVAVIIPFLAASPPTGGAVIKPAAEVPSSAQAESSGDWIKVGRGGVGGDFQQFVNGITSLEEYGGAIYAGTTSCEVWRKSDGSWSPVSQPGFGDESNLYVNSLRSYGGRLYAGTSNPTSGCQLWAWDGASWSLAASGGFGNPENVMVGRMAEFEGHLYVGTQNDDEGCEIWRWDGITWEQVMGQDPAGTPGTGPGFGEAGNVLISSLLPYGGELLAGTQNTVGCQVWRFKEGAWSPLTADGFGDPQNHNLHSMAVFQDALFMGTTHMIHGFQVWRWDGFDLEKVGQNGGGGAVCMLAHEGLLYVGIFDMESGCELRAWDGSSWAAAAEPGFGESSNWDPTDMLAYGGKLHVSTASMRYGAEIWRHDGSGWSKICRTGLVGNSATEASCMAFHRDRLYAGTEQGNGCAVWRYRGSSWERVNADGFGEGFNKRASSMASFDGMLYAGTRNEHAGCQVWRYDGSSWEKVADGGFGDRHNISVSSMAVFGEHLYAGVENADVFGGGCQVWRYDGSSWEKAAEDGFGDHLNISVESMAVLDGALYAGTLNMNSFGQSDGCQVWRYDGSSWEKVADGGFGSNANLAASSLQACGGFLYAGTWNEGGCQVFKYDGGSWSKTSTSEMETGGNSIVASMAAARYGDVEALYAGTGNEDHGGQVWRYDGSSWVKAAEGGFKDPQNIGSVSMASRGPGGHEVYVGTLNRERGCEIWALQPSRIWYLAEGCTEGGMETFVLVQNPGEDPATVDLILQTADGELRPPALQGQVIPGSSRCTWRLNDHLGSWEVSTLVRADAPVVAERAMYGEGRGWAHESDGVNALSERWLLAEGCTRGGFDTFLLLQNPQESDVRVDVAFQTEYGKAVHPALQGLWIPARSRRSIRLNDFVYSWNFSTEATSTAPVVCERAMYGGGWAWAHDSRGVTEPAGTWFLAEGCTEGGMETFVLVQNPGDAPGQVRLTFMTSAGEKSGPTAYLPPQTRLTFRLNDHVNDWDVSTLVESDVPVVCERAMYGSGWAWAHEAAGSPAPSQVWYLAEGCTEGGMETFVLVQNPGDAQAVVDIVLHTGSGEVRPPGLQGNVVPAGSRRTFRLNDHIADWNVSATVLSTAPVVCERSMYGGGWAWAHCSPAYSP